MKEKVLFAVCKDKLDILFSQADLQRIRNVCDVIEAEIPVKKNDKEFLLKHIETADIAISSWGTARFDSDVIAKGQNLKLVAHAAGSIRPVISEALTDKGIKVISAASAIASGVAEHCLGLILTLPKRVFWAAMASRKGKWQRQFEDFGKPFDLYGQNVGIIGASHVGRHLIKLLKPFECNTFLYDPYCSASEAEKLGVSKVETLDELFSGCMIVSVNAPGITETNNMIRGKHFRLLPDGAVFINTARSSIVNQDEMIEELRRERFVACIDVTDPEEPPPKGYPLRKLPNVLLTPHFAGAIAQGESKIGRLVADEIEAFVTGRTLNYQVTEQDLQRMA